MGVRARSAALIDHGTGACALRAFPQARVTQQYSCGDGGSLFDANVSTPPSPRPGSGGQFEVWDSRPSNTFCDHDVAVDLRRGNANTKTPRSFARLDPVCSCDNSGRSVICFHQKGVKKIIYLVSLIQEA